MRKLKIKRGVVNFFKKSERELLRTYLENYKEVLHNDVLNNLGVLEEGVLLSRVEQIKSQLREFAELGGDKILITEYFIFLEAVNYLISDFDDYRNIRNYTKWLDEKYHSSSVKTIISFFQEEVRHSFTDYSISDLENEFSKWSVGLDVDLEFFVYENIMNVQKIIRQRNVRV